VTAQVEGGPRAQIFRRHLSHGRRTLDWCRTHAASVERRTARSPKNTSGRSGSQTSSLGRDRSHMPSDGVAPQDVRRFDSLSSPRRSRHSATSATTAGWPNLRPWRSRSLGSPACRRANALGRCGPHAEPPMRRLGKTTMAAGRPTPERGDLARHKTLPAGTQKQPHQGDGPVHRQNVQFSHLSRRRLEPFRVADEKVRFPVSCSLENTKPSSSSSASTPYEAARATVNCFKFSY
jgi:hypothetical protein